MNAIDIDKCIIFERLKQNLVHNILKIFFNSLEIKDNENLENFKEI